MKKSYLLLTAVGLAGLAWPASPLGLEPVSAFLGQESQEALYREIGSLTQQLAKVQDQNLELQRQLVAGEVARERQMEELRAMREEFQAQKQQAVVFEREYQSARQQLELHASVKDQMESLLTTYIFTPEWGSVEELVQSANQVLGPAVTFYAGVGSGMQPKRQSRDRFTPLYSSNQIIITEFPAGMPRALDFLKSVDQSIGEVQSQSQPAPAALPESPQVLLRCWLVAPNRLHGDGLESIPTALQTGLKTLVPTEDFGCLAKSVTRCPATGRIEMETSPSALSQKGPHVDRWTVEVSLEAFHPTTKQLKLREFRTALRYSSGREDSLATSLTLTEGEYAVVGSVRGGQSYVVLSFQTL